MSRNISYHDVTSIEVATINCHQLSSDDSDFYARELVITMSDGSTERIGLFSDNGYHLLIDDKELDSMRPVDLLKAA